MDDDELLDVLTWVEERVPQRDKAARFEQEAVGLMVGEHGRASLLIAAGEHWQMRGEIDEARRCFREAGQDGGESRSDPMGHLLSLALAEGDAAAVKVYDVELRQLVRLDLMSRSTCHLVGESYEIHDQPRSALRWYNIPFTHDDPIDDDPTDQLLLEARRRVRSALGMAPELLDSLVEPG